MSEDEVKKRDRRLKVLELVGEASLLMVGNQPIDPNRTIEIADEIIALFEEEEPQ